jgi:hypothetical protein
MKIVNLIATLFLLTSCGVGTYYKKLKPKIEAVDPNVKLGCLEISAANYDATAEEDAGSCSFRYCSDPSFQNYSKEQHEIVVNYAAKFKLDIKTITQNTCTGKLGCMEDVATNFNSTAELENESCLFNLCRNPNYLDYNAIVIQKADAYVAKYGEDINGSPRITEQCLHPLQFCDHKEATNYSPRKSPQSQEWCEFKACDKVKYTGYAKYLEYLEYLKIHRGKIITDNSDVSCGPKIISEFDLELDIKKGLDDTPVRISMIMDNSTSMADEIDKVKASLKALAPHFVNLELNLDLEFYKISEVNLTKTRTEIASPNPKIKNFLLEYQRPTPYAMIPIRENGTPAKLIEDIEKAIDAFDFDPKLANEQGMCYLTRLIKDFKNKPNDKLVNVLITDEDDAYKGKSTNCPETTLEQVFTYAPTTYTHTYFKDSLGKDTLNSVMLEKFNAMTTFQRDSFAFVGLFYDVKNTSCKPGQNTHAETYLAHIDSLQAAKLKAAKGDLCATNYNDLLQRTLFESLLEVIGFKYQYADYLPAPELLEVQFIDATGHATSIPNSDYELVVEAGKSYVRFGFEMKDLLKQNSKIKLTLRE